MSTALPPGWTAYKTADGKEYYYHAQTKVTQWDRPKAPAAARSTTKTASSEPVPTPPVSGGGGDRGSLLAQISQGTKLKKTVTRESSPLDAVKSSSPSSTSSTGGSGGGGGNPLFAAIAQGAAGLKKSTHRTPSFRASEQPSPTDTASSSSGGFAEIMRKNREAAAKKAGSTDATNTNSGSASPVPQPSYSAASVVRQSLASMAPASSTTEFADQLNRIEAKLDKLLAHLNISE